jgi:hypothetical protein
MQNLRTDKTLNVAELTHSGSKVAEPALHFEGLIRDLYPNFVGLPKGPMNLKSSAPSPTQGKSGVQKMEIKVDTTKAKSPSLEITKRKEIDRKLQDAEAKKQKKEEKLMKKKLFV